MDPRVHAPSLSPLDVLSELVPPSALGETTMWTLELTDVLPPGNSKSPDGFRSGPLCCCVASQMARTFSACGPLGPCVTSNSTFWFSSRDL